MSGFSGIRSVLCAVLMIFGTGDGLLAARVHVVKAGETLTSIAENLGVTVLQLARANQLHDADLLQPGQELTIPEKSPSYLVHTVQRGETLSSIATHYDITTGELARTNNLPDADHVERGQKLRVPRTPVTYVEHRVERGEMLATIANRYSVTVTDIVRTNDLRNADLVRRGQILKIPLFLSASPASLSSPPVYRDHVVKKGETLSSIALAQGVSVAAIEAANPGVNPRRLVVKQKLRIPVTDTDHIPAAAAPDPRRQLPPNIKAAIDKAKVKKGRWKHLVIHHSGTDEGSGKNMDRYHREERRMENGLAYHFVIGNGHGMSDGEIHVGRRWTEQLDGGHLASAELNAESLGLCLVGDFQAQEPTKRQLQRLEALVRALLEKTGLDVSAVTTHKLIHQNHTLCPGRHFPTEEFIARLRDP